MNTIDLFDLAIHAVTMEEAVQQVVRLANTAEPSFVVTPNVDHVVKLQDDREFRELYQKASLVVADGMPLVWVSRLVGTPLPERVTGADLFIEVCGEAERLGLGVYLLGSASQDIIEKTSAGLMSRFPRLRVVGAHSPSFGFEKNSVENQNIVHAIKKAKPEILFVGVGAPKQEKWISQNYSALGVPVSLGVGAAFDFVAGSVRRAPVWMQKSGLEWFYRLTKEPARMFQRYLIDDSRFFGLTLRELYRSRAKKKAQHG